MNFKFNKVFIMSGINYIKLLVSILVCQIAGFIGSYFTAPAISGWYAELNKPFFTPPDWLFAPAWITLYFLMGVSLYIVWNKGLESRQSKIAVIIFAIQLVLNTLWSLIFFGLQAPLFAFIWIILLLVAIFATIFYFYRISRPAAYLLVPYILWVSFAAVLNFAIYYLN